MTTGSATPASGAGEGSCPAEELEKLFFRFLEGGPARRVSGWLGWLTGGVSFFVGAMALYWTQFSITTSVYRATFLTVCLALIFILIRLPARSDGAPVTRRPSLEELVVALIAAAILAYVLHHPNPAFTVYGRSNFAYGLGLLVIAGFRPPIRCW